MAVGGTSPVQQARETELCTKILNIRLLLIFGGC
jgi:hypothetical protein